MTFHLIFQQTDVAACIQPGIQAFGQYSRLIDCNDPQRFEGSVELDDCLLHRYPQDNRWDYAFGFDGRIYYVEVHHVSDSEVSVVIAKYCWLKDWQNRQPDPSALKRNGSYYWVSSGKGALTKNSRYTRSLTKAGLDYPRKTLKVD